LARDLRDGGGVFPPNCVQHDAPSNQALSSLQLQPTGNVSGVYPECGTPIPKEAAGSSVWIGRVEGDADECSDLELCVQISPGDGAHC
jgi:hypothetical protein